MIRDDFAGPGGWEEGAELIGLGGIIGVEHDRAACATAVAAGHARLLADATTVPFRTKLDGYIASPPCTAFSSAGKRHGTNALDLILKAIDGVFLGDESPAEELVAACADPTAALVLQPARAILAARPRWVALEQVPAVAPVWARIAQWLNERAGYSAWAGILNAADYGVPQTRKRAILIASLDRQVGPPPPTHAEEPQGSLFGPEPGPWRSMASALDWLPADATVGFPRLDDLGTSSGAYRERDWRPADAPAFTLTEKARDWKVRTGNNSHVTGHKGSRAGEGDVQAYERDLDRPAPTLDTKAGGAWRIIGVNTGRDWKAGGSRADAQVVSPSEPAPTIDGKGRWHAVNADGDIVYRLDLTDALILQSFRPDYPVAGTRTKGFEQVGNAIPPLLAAHVLATATGRELTKEGTP